MVSPAQRHMMRVSAMEAAQRVDNPLRHANVYEQMLVRLAADRTKLKQIYSVEKKAEHKRAMLPAYAPWVAGVLAEGRGAQDDILMTVMQWKLDADDIPGALQIAPYALKYRLKTPNNKRPAAYLFAEEIAASAERLRKSGSAVSLSDMQTAIAMIANEDMPDVVKAKLHKVTGLILRDKGDHAQALEHLTRAMQLDSNAGVKKEAQKCETALKPKPVAKKTTARPRKAVATPAKRGRPRKAIKTAG
ncbi:TPA: terminase [Serratia marcescens]|uniref:phage terminase small subunit n=1 Tax=Serratia TaxID=613 RepID=UPI001C3C131B|nr:phage terminase small subunit [Serratia marcescens]CAI1191112.1 Phage small terminase subunit [Serratia marcescens]HBH6977908.1 terminase [Serratia marcescens]